MGSSGGGSFRQPNMPTPGGTQVPYGQTSPIQPQYQSFLPTQSGAVATGLTPQMMQAVDRPPPPPRQMQQQQMDPNMMRQMIAQLISQHGLMRQGEQNRLNRMNYARQGSGR